MKVDPEEARRIAMLAHIEMTGEQLVTMAGQMSEILTYVDQLAEADEPIESAQPEATPLRDDIARPGIERELVARNAPAWNDGFFIVPRVIGE